MNNESLQQQNKDLNEALKQANDRNMDLLGELSKRDIDPFTRVSFSVVTIIHENLQGGVMVYPVPDNLVGKAKVAAILRQAANNIMKTTIGEE